MLRWGWTLVAALALVGCDDESDGGGAAGAGGAAVDGAGGAGGGAEGGGPDMLAEAPDMQGEAPDMAPDSADMEGDEPDMASGDPDMMAADGSVNGACPPAGPFGNRVGDVAPDLMLPDCDGSLHSVHAECGQPLWIFGFAAWCPPCRRFAGGMDALYTDLGRDQLNAWVILSATADGSPVDANFCRQVTEQYGLTMPVLYDANGDFQRVYGVAPNEVNVLIDAEGVLRYSNQYGGERGLRGAVEALAE